jgi:two-component system, OmpR family, sensor kinase
VGRLPGPAQALRDDARAAGFARSTAAGGCWSAGGQGRRARTGGHEAMVGGLAGVGHRILAASRQRPWGQPQPADGSDVRREVRPALGNGIHRAVSTQSVERLAVSGIGQEPGPDVGCDGRSFDVRPPGGLWSLRTRLVVGFGLFLLLALGVSLFAARLVLLGRLDARIDAALAQEVEELRAFSESTDPVTGRRLGEDARRLFELYLQNNVPMENEAIVTYVGGAPYLRSRPVVPYRLDRDAALTARWASLDRTDRGAVRTPAGRVKFVAVPVRVDGQPEGVYVGAIFRDLERAEVDDALRVVVVVGLLLVAVGCALAANLADRILRPVAEASSAARAISDTDLSQRIPVSGRDEIAALATTLNGMLERLEDAFEAQRRFIDDVGHELRTPLTIVQGHLEQLDGDDPAEREETLRLVLDEVQRMGRLVGELVILARAERPYFLDVGPVDIEDLTQELVAKAAALGDRRWQLDAAAQGRIVADRQRLTQAVVQLAENAVRHTGPGEVIALGSALSGREARIWVRDDGPGIPPEEQSRVFERFRRGDRSRAGSGLGLSIVRAIAEAHGGRVELRSRPGAGATFTLVVPLEGASEVTA